jgi:hypothetical protein
MPSTYEYPAGTDEYPAGTDEYPAGTDEYSACKEYPGTRARNQEACVVRQKFWQRLGFESLEAYLEEVEAGWERIGWSRDGRRDRRSTPAPSLPRAQPPDRVRRSSLRSRQVNVKLTPEDGDRLERVARLYGLPRTTMAQLLVNRGVRAVLEDEEVPEGD